MTKGEQIEKLLMAGEPLADIARAAGVHVNYVYDIKRAGSYQNWLARNRNQYHISARADGVPQSCAHGCVKVYDYDPHEIVAAVESGGSYADVARSFGLTRGVVSGVVDRSRKRVAA